MSKLQFRFVGSDQWIDSPQASAEDAAYHAMQLHGGRIGRGVRKVGDRWHPRARKAAATPVEVREIA